MNDAFLLKFQDTEGLLQTVIETTAIFKEADECKMSVPELLDGKYPTSHPTLTTFEQMALHSGLVMQQDRRHHYKPPSLKDLRAGTAAINMAGIVAPEGGGDSTVLPGTRLLVGPVILEMIASSLMKDASEYIAAVNAATAASIALTSPVYWTPVIDLNPPRSSLQTAVAQGEEPDIMANVTISQITQRIGRKSIGLKISDEALEFMTIDLVGITLREQAIGYQIARIDQDLAAIFNGDASQGTSTLADVAYAEDYDSTLHGHPGTLSHKAWINWVIEKYKYETMSHLFLETNDQLAIDQRSGRPPQFVSNPGQGWVDLNCSPRMLGIPADLQAIRVDNGFLGGNKIVGMDRGRGMRQMTWAGGTYSAMQQFVLSRQTVFRFDVSTRLERMFQDGRGFRVLYLTDRS